MNARLGQCSLKGCFLKIQRGGRLGVSGKELKNYKIVADRWS